MEPWDTVRTKQKEPERAQTIHDQERPSHSTSLVHRLSSQKFSRSYCKRHPLD